MQLNSEIVRAELFYHRGDIVNNQLAEFLVNITKRFKKAI